MDLDAVPYLPARYQTPGRPLGISQIVLHSTEGGSSAKAVAQMFAAPSSPRASTHYTTGQDGSWCSVQPDAQAWATGHGVSNQRSISIEQVGWAKWSREEWLAQSVMLDHTRDLLRALSDRYAIPLVRLTPDEVRQGRSGVCSHNDITQAFAIYGGHTDTGAGYPWDVVLAQDQPSEEEDMAEPNAIIGTSDGRMWEVWPYAARRRWIRGPEELDVLVALGVKNHGVLEPQNDWWVTRYEEVDKP